jgi:NAD(P)-dependent dehydrogenase (short-subunit alcohol dehydrogenase family)
MDLTHTGKVAIVTGASQGIGREIARELGRRGAKLVLVDLKAPEAALESTGADSISLTEDVSLDSSWQKIAAAAMDAFGRADIVVNNAGIYPNAMIDDVTDEMWRRMFAVNVDAHFYSARRILPLMRKNGWGRFVNISSNSIGFSLPGLSHYMASKMAVIGFVRGLANDVGDDGITVNAVLPAPTRTPGMAAIPSEMLHQIAQDQPIKRVAESEDIAGPVVFLTTEDARYITGQALVVDGGRYKIT